MSSSLAASACTPRRKIEDITDLVEDHGNAHGLKLDVTSAEDIRAVVDEVEQDAGVDVLVNNALLQLTMVSHA